jgi:hypothetical protein
VGRALGCSFEHRDSFLAISCEGSGVQEELACVGVISGAAGEISGDSWEKVIVPHCWKVEQWEYEIESSLWPECSTGGDCTVEFHHRRWVDLCEPVVERRHAWPVGVDRGPRSGVTGGDRGLERVLSGGAM